MYNIQKLTKEVNETLQKANITYKCPVKINGRLTRVLGRAIFQTNVWTGSITLVGIEFSRQLLNVATDHTIREVLLHECAHVIANMRMGSNQGHNAYFKKVCHEIGTHNDKTYTEVEYKTSTAPTSRYEVNCPNCGVIGKYDRKCKTLQAINRCSCRKCGSHSLSVQTNW